jgi:phospholipid transport system substrate-binding protein
MTISRGPVRGPSRRGALIAAVLLTLFAAPVAAADGEAPEAVVSQLARQVIDLLQRGELERPDGLERLAAAIDDDTDLNRLARLVLGRHWRSATDAQQEEYQRLFRQLMLKKFVGHLGAYSNRQLGPSDELFQVTGSRTVGGGDVIVDSVVRPPDRPPLAAAWRLRPGDDGSFVIIDLIVANVSLLISQRSEFASVIERGGIDDLLDEMRTRLESTRS